MPKKILDGIVVSDKGDKSITVLVERKYQHPLFKKVVKSKKRYSAHDENNKFITHVYKLFKNIYLSDKLDDKFKMSCWKWFDLFIKISETYYIQFGEVKGFEVRFLLLFVQQNT